MIENLALSSNKMKSAYSPKNNHFDRSKPFYPLVMHFIVQLIGFKELAVRGIAGAQDVNALISQVIGKVAIEGHEHEVDDVKRQLNKLMGPLELRTEQDDDYITVDIDEIAQEIASNFTYLSSFVMQSASNVLILAHELCKDKRYHKSEIWEFLRHCRNAAAHGGLFNFLHGEPRRSAKWGKFKITPVLQGTPLFKDKNKQGLISPGDVIRLLWDIEQTYPQMD